MTDGHVTLEGIRNLIMNYDREVIVPREKGILDAHNVQHDENKKRFGALEKTVSAIKEILAEYKWPLRALIAMMGVILLHTILLWIHGK